MNTVGGNQNFYGQLKNAKAEKSIIQSKAR